MGANSKLCPCGSGKSFEDCHAWLEPRLLRQSRVAVCSPEYGTRSYEFEAVAPEQGTRSYAFERVAPEWTASHPEWLGRPMPDDRRDLEDPARSEAFETRHIERTAPPTERTAHHGHHDERGAAQVARRWRRERPGPWA
jgi:hypothetical protein